MSFTAIAAVVCLILAVAYVFFPRSRRSSNGMSKGVALVKDLIKTTKVLVVSKTYCPYCTKAKDILKKFNIPSKNIEILEIEGLEDMDDIQDYLREITGARSVPRVFIGGKCIGGGDDTAALDRQGKLKTMLQEVGAI